MADTPLALAVQPAMNDPAQRRVIHKMLSEMLITISDKVFIEKTFSVDGYRFVNCRFEKCGLSTYRGTFEFHHCWIDEQSTRLFGADAQKSVQFFVMKGKEPSVPAEFSPKIYPDGSISIAIGVSLS
jgi:hypothetical protein